MYTRSKVTFKSRRDISVLAQEEMMEFRIDNPYGESFSIRASQECIRFTASNNCSMMEWLAELRAVKYWNSKQGKYTPPPPSF